MARTPDAIREPKQPVIVDDLHDWIGKQMASKALTTAIYLCQTSGISDAVVDRLLECQRDLRSEVGA